MITFVLKGPHYDSTAKFLPISAEKAENFTRKNFIEIVNALVATEKAYGAKANEAAEKIIHFYESQKFYSKNFYLQILAQLFSDLTFNIPAMREALQKAAAGHEIYFFVYDFSPEIIKSENELKIFEGAGHGFDYANIFGNPPDGPFIDWKDPDIAKVQKLYADLFINFAKTGIPSSAGVTVAKVTTDSKLPYLYINVNSEMKENLWPDRFQFWDKMAKEYGFDLPELRKLFL
uniref:Carboxylesterase type B domain-containing protein n=1 Tax=Panagrolaimus sp. ES5 TaxID=591445 RepID=A0AC34FFT9_9BILA